MRPTFQPEGQGDQRDSGCERVDGDQPTGGQDRCCGIRDHQHQDGEAEQQRNAPERPRNHSPAIALRSLKAAAISKMPAKVDHTASMITVRKAYVKVASIGSKTKITPATMPVSPRKISAPQRSPA